MRALEAFNETRYKLVDYGIFEDGWNAAIANTGSLLEKLEKLRREHYYCEDSWYSCPKAEGGCSNVNDGDECNCDADEKNKLLDEIINDLRYEHFVQHNRGSGRVPNRGFSCHTT